MIPFTPAWSLLARLDGLIARLEQASHAIGSAGQDSRLRKRIGLDLARRVSDHTQTLKVRRKKVAGGQVPQSAWAEVKSSAAASLLDECLLYLQAARSRGPDVAPDLCEITDALFEELAERANGITWKSFSVFAAEDSFDVLKQIIRLRYPIAGVWDLPIAVHEFGHFLSGHLRQVLPDGSASLVFQDHKRHITSPQRAQQKPASEGSSDALPQASASGTGWPAWVDEIFADVFAAYAAGPAFACSCLLFRFDPGSADEEPDGKHPSFAKRAYVILQTLRRRNVEQPGRGKLSLVIQRLDTAWRDACTTAGISPDISGGHRTWLDGQIAAFYDLLVQNQKGLRFDQWDSALDKLSWLQEPPENPAKFTIVELLNTAWMGRLKANSNVQRLGASFVELARRKT